MTTALLAIAIGLTLIAAALAPRGAALRAGGVAALALAATSCTPRQEALTADAIAIAADTAGERLAERERAEGHAAIEASATREESDRALDAVRARYRPVWAHYDVLAAAHEAWAVVLRAGGQPSPELARAVVAALCALLPAAEDVGVDVAGALAGVPLAAPLAAGCGGGR